jgi:hypothetical protein
LVLARRNRRRLFEDGETIRAADAEAVERGAPRRAGNRKILQLCVYVKG